MDQGAPIEEPQEPTRPEYRLADLNTRMMAVVLDMALLLMFVWPALVQISNAINGPLNTSDIAAAFSASSSMGDAQRQAMQSQVIGRYIFDSILQIVVAGALIIPCWVKLGATPGKYIFRMRVVDTQNFKLLSWKHAILRYLCYASCILSLGIGILWVALSKKRRGFHDLLAGTSVIILPKGQSTV